MSAAGLVSSMSLIGLPGSQIRPTLSKNCTWFSGTVLKRYNTVCDLK
jgi:hypothetical protein